MFNLDFNSYNNVLCNNMAQFFTIKYIKYVGMLDIMLGYCHSLTCYNQEEAFYLAFAVESHKC